MGEFDPRGCTNMSAESVLSVEELELPEDFDESQFEDPEDFVDDISDEGERVSCRISITELIISDPRGAVASL